MDVDAPTLAAIDRLGFEVIDRRAFAQLDLTVTRVALPRGYPTLGALAQIQSVAPTSIATSHHLYTTAAIDCDHPGCYGRDLIGWQFPSDNCLLVESVGMVDTAVAPDHPAMLGRDLTTQSFRSVGNPSDADHGTAIASLLVGGPDGGVPGLLPSTSFIAADVFHRDGDGNIRASAIDVVTGLEWLAEQRIPVINMSLAGPDNVLLRVAVARLIAQGTVIVAAAGNNGPAAPPSYPGAYPGVIAVTAVDRLSRPFQLASRGDHVTFAAPGVDVWAAAPGLDGDVFSGTSFAAAYVTGIVAAILGDGGGMSPEAVIRQMREDSVDLGEPGHDALFGYGLAQLPAQCR